MLDTAGLLANHQGLPVVVGLDFPGQSLKFRRARVLNASQDVGSITGLLQQGIQVNEFDARAGTFVDAALQAPEFFDEEGGISRHGVQLSF